jgi:ubiquinone/menaquinone biosynthesis C-methylase UbiE
MKNYEPDEINKRKQKISGVFNRAVENYDLIGPKFFSHFGKRLVEEANISKGAQVLDVATGRGAVLFPSIKAVGPEGQVTGIDLSKVMVRETAKEISRRKLENAHVRQMDAEYLQFEAASFDYVLSGLGLLFFPQPERALAEMFRVLRPGGRIALSTWDRSGDEDWEWFEDLAAAQLPPEVEQTTNAVTTPDLDMPEGLERMMKTLGFSNIHIFRESAEKVYKDDQEWWAALWATSMREMLEDVEQATGVEGLERFRIIIFDKLRNLRQEDGIHARWSLLFALADKPNV